MVLGNKAKGWKVTAGLVSDRSIADEIITPCPSYRTPVKMAVTPQLFSVVAGASKLPVFLLSGMKTAPGCSVNTPR